ncbi:hypothetical protein CDD81_166 [Ophiocordyceps australis]|uniref:Glucose-methanol-choline oxidoreductase N-terminal domain-containing protein n=1 Tax=Ophiocordyceps australis TaxID=1399860 RepID=A0A2C5YER6_9HYPO|nr:hypothetical protein CDD81_166 [Ophiocordyceps australis]
MTRQDMDWNITSQPGVGINGRRIELTRGKFVGGSSGCNGTLVVRGTKRDVDDWEVPGWSGDEFFQYMRKSLA